MRLASASGLMIAIGLASLAQAQTFKTLYTFTGGTDGNAPETTLLLYNGKLYGTTPTGGAFGTGTVFQLEVATGVLTVLHTFAGAPLDGSESISSVIRDAFGNLYGTTQLGGSANLGIVFKLDPTGAFVILHSFGGTDGQWPGGGVVMDLKGNLFGTCESGGAHNYGTVYKLDPTGKLTTLYSFTNRAHPVYRDGAAPMGTLVLQGVNLYGTTVSGGQNHNGAVFAVNGNTGKETVLYNMPPNQSGGPASSNVVSDGTGNLYGTSANIWPSSDTNGAIYALNISTRKVTVLYEFAIDGSDGQPLGIIRDSVGNFYGTTSGRRTFGYGKIFKLDSTGNFATLYNFSGTPNDLGSTGGLIQDPSSGTLYGPGGTYSLTGNIFQLIP